MISKLDSSISMSLRDVYRWAFGPPGPALARARGGPLNLGPGQPGTNIHRAVSCPFTGCGDSPSPGPSCCFVPGWPAIARPYVRPRAARSPQRGEDGSTGTRRPPCGARRPSPQSKKLRAEWRDGRRARRRRPDCCRRQICAGRKQGMGAVVEDLRQGE
jgi:hypothetical protein